MKIIFCFLTLVLATAANSQSRCKDLDYQEAIKPYLEKGRLFDSVIKSYERSSAPLVNEFGKINASKWEMCPVVRISYDYKKGFYFDTTFRVIIINKIHNLFYEFDFNAPNVVRKIREIPYIENQLADKRPPFFFLPFFLDFETSNYDIIGYCNGDNISLQNTHSDISYSLEELIKYKYGSIEKLIEMYGEQRKFYEINALYRPNTLAGAIKLIRDDWASRSKYIPRDTSGNIDLFIQQINNGTDLTSEQKALLRQNMLSVFHLIKASKITASFYSTHTDFTMYNFDLLDIVHGVLTKKQSAECEIYFRGFKKCMTIADNFIFSISSNNKSYENKMKSLFRVDSANNLTK